MRSLASLILTTVLLLSSCSGYFQLPEACTAVWEDDVDLTLVRQVRQDIARAEKYGCRRLVITLYSPGGSVLDGLEIVRQMRAAKQRGLILEIHGGVLVASMGTVILAHGTPGYRYTSYNTLAVIHAIRSGYMSENCVSYIHNPQTEDGKISNYLLMAMAQAIAEGTNQPLQTVLHWLDCGKEQVGDGNLLVQLGFADATE